MGINQFARLRDFTSEPFLYVQPVICNKQTVITKKSSKHNTQRKYIRPQVDLIVFDLRSA